MTVAALRNQIVTDLSRVTTPGEAMAMMREIFAKTLHWQPVDIALRGNYTLEPETTQRIGAITQRVIAGEPLQYVLGCAYFMGMELKVTPAVLIPRPETAQLVDMAIDFAKERPDLNVLDICTGSGCIAIALAKALSFATVTATDISPQALAVAAENARQQACNITLTVDDALDSSLPEAGQFDIIISNPPYILPSEAPALDSRVRDHEPHLALFASEQGLEFYRAISQWGYNALAPVGGLFFEINPLRANALETMLNQQPWREVTLLRDFNAQYRFAVCLK